MFALSSRLSSPVGLSQKHLNAHCFQFYPLHSLRSSSLARYTFQRAADVSAEVDKAVAAFHAQQLRKRKEPQGQRVNTVDSPSNPPAKVSKASPKQEGAPPSQAALRLSNQLKACQKVCRQLMRWSHSRETKAHQWQNWSCRCSAVGTHVAIPTACVFYLSAMHSAIWPASARVPQLSILQLSAPTAPLVQAFNICRRMLRLWPQNVQSKRCCISNSRRLPVYMQRQSGTCRIG